MRRHGKHLVGQGLLLLRREVGRRGAARADLAPGSERVGIWQGDGRRSVGMNLDVLYTLPGGSRSTSWVPYVGTGPNFSLSHRGFEAEEDDGSRFDFGDTDFEGGFNFIAGARKQNGMFLEMKATAYGVSNIRLLAGFNF